MPISTNAVTQPTLVRFTRRLAHDLNNFTTIVSTYSELLLADLDPASPTHADVVEIQKAADGLVRYLARVTRFARASAMKRTAVSVAEGIRSAADAFRAERPGRELVVTGATDATIMADPVWWTEVVGELLCNADEAAPQGTPIQIAASQTANQLVLAVRDRGPGIDPALGANLCDPLVTSKEGIRGAGMGLALVAAFAETLGGTVSIDRIGDETVVTLALPTS